MIKNYFIAGTDTGIGKTLVSAVLARALRASYWKPIQSGIDDDVSDHDSVKQLTGLPAEHFFPSSYLLKASLSPNQAADLENTIIDLNNCKMPTASRSLIIEGAGGVCVPLNNTETLLDLMLKLNLPIVIVSHGKLGTINHTLLTIKVLRQYGLTIHGVIFNGAISKASQQNIEQWGNVRTLLHIPQFDNVTPETIQKWSDSQQQKILENFA